MLIFNTIINLCHHSCIYLGAHFYFWFLVLVFIFSLVMYDNRFETRKLKFKPRMT